MLIAIISDIHEDIRNLEKALNFIHKQGQLKIACLGDIVGYTKKYFDTKHQRNANACIEIVRQHCDFVVAGNHDLAAAKKFPGNIKDMDLPEDWFELPEDKQFESSSGMLWAYDDHEPDILQKNLEYLQTLRDYDCLDADGSRIMFSHYPFPDLTGFRSRFIGFAEELNDHFDFMQRKKCRLGFFRPPACRRDTAGW
ncbi:MAG: metallophosphoesterase family protein [Bacteroidota bacterium]|nr:metallophosphoesterase family protein [Bacteroidota bacterium]